MVEQLAGTLAWAFEQLKAGMRITNVAWVSSNGTYIQFNNGTLYTPNIPAAGCFTIYNFMDVFHNLPNGWKRYKVLNIYTEGTARWAYDQLKNGEKIRSKVWNKNSYILESPINSITTDIGHPFYREGKIVVLDNFVDSVKADDDMLPWELYDEISIPVIHVILYKTNLSTQEFYIACDKGPCEGFDEADMRTYIMSKLNGYCPASAAKDMFIELFDKIINTSLIDHITVNRQ